MRLVDLIYLDFFVDNGNSNLVQNKPNLIRSNYQDQYDINNDVDNTQNAQWFLKQISTKSKDITDHIENYEKLINDCSADIPEEIVGKIRASIGKANLLLSKKFKQFHQLCQDSIVRVLLYHFFSKYSS